VKHNPLTVIEQVKRDFPQLTRQIWAMLARLAIVGLKKALIRMKNISHESWLAGTACAGRNKQCSRC